MAVVEQKDPNWFFAFSLAAVHPVLFFLSLPGRKLPHRTREFRQPVKYGHAAQPYLVVDAGEPADYGTRGNIARNAALGGDDSPVPDLAMTCHPDLAGQNHITADLG